MPALTLGLVKERRPMLRTNAAIWIMAALAIFGGGTAQAAMKNSQQCMTMHHSRDADANFIRDMIPHHQMAVDMVEKELAKGKGPKARVMAQKILDAQKKEISDMKMWLKNKE